MKGKFLKHPETLSPDQMKKLVGFFPEGNI